MNNNQIVPFVAAGGGGWALAELAKFALLPFLSSVPHSVVDHVQPSQRVSTFERETNFECPPCQVCLNDTLQPVVLSIGDFSKEFSVPTFYLLLGILLGLAIGPCLDLLFVGRAKWRLFIQRGAGVQVRRPSHLPPNPLL